MINQNATGPGVGSNDQLYFARTLPWYEANDPTWIVYRPNRTTPAWEFCPTLTAATCDSLAGETPLAIWLAGVVTYVEGADIAAAVTAGIYQAISMDNMNTENSFLRAGTCSVAVNPATGDCAANGGTWTDEYSNAASTTTAVYNSGATTLNVANGNVFTNGWNERSEEQGPAAELIGTWNKFAHRDLDNDSGDLRDHPCRHSD